MAYPGPGTFPGANTYPGPTFPGTGDPDIVAAHSVTQTLSTVGAPFTGDPVAAHSVTETSSTAGLPVEFDYVRAHSVTETSSHAVPGLDLKLDPVTHLPQFRLLVVDRQGQQQRELRGAVLGDAVYRLGGDLDFSFAIPKNHPRASLLGIGAEVQLWSGDTPIRESWFVIVADPTDSGPTLTYKCKGLREHLEHVVIGKPRPELLLNGGFEDDMKHWHPTWLSGSAAEAPPDCSIVSGSQALAGGKALRTTAVERVVVKEVQTAAIFYGNRPYASEALSAGYLPGGEQIIRDQVKDFAKGTAILVEGFTADVDSGTGQALSERRADAAKATILAFRPDLVVTAIGRGESVQVASNRTAAGQARNRRIVITGSATRIGHRQIVQQWFSFTNTTRVAMKLELDGWLNLIDYVGPSKDGWGLYINRRKATAPHKILDEQHTDIEATFPKERWTPDGTSILAPNDGAEHIYEVRLYGTAGDTKFDEISCKPNVLTAWYNVTRPTLFAGLVAHAQDAAFGKVDLNIETNCPSFGARDDFEYEHKAHRTVNDALGEQLRADDAPDFAIVTTSTRRIATTWARRGRRNPVHLELGGIVESYTGGGDIDKLATTGIVTSNLNGGGTTEAYAHGALVNGLVIERVVATEPNRTKARAAQVAARMVRYGREDVIDSVTCRPSKTVGLLGRVWLGDTVRRTVRDGRVDADGWARVTEVRLSFARGQLTYSLTQE